MSRLALRALLAKAALLGIHGRCGCDLFMVGILLFTANVYGNLQQTVNYLQNVCQKITETQKAIDLYHEEDTHRPTLLLWH